VRTNIGSDLPRHNPAIKTIANPYGEGEVSVVPALRVDVAIIQAQRADAQGNTQTWGIIGEQREAAYAAERVIVVAEEIVEPEMIRADPNRTLLPDFKKSSAEDAASSYFIARPLAQAASMASAGRCSRRAGRT